MTRQLVYSPDAVADLEEVFRLIAADNPKRARTYIDNIRQACRSLCDAPMIDVLRVFSGGRDDATIMGET